MRGAAGGYGHTCAVARASLSVAGALVAQPPASKPAHSTMLPYQACMAIRPRFIRNSAVP